MEENAADLTIGSSASSLIRLTDEEARSREWDIIRREKNLIDQEKAFLIKEKELGEKLKMLEQNISPGVNTSHALKVNCSIREIADVLPVFLPGDISSMSADSWLNRVETLAKIYAWDERALLMAAASKMQGPARFWWDTVEGAFTSWADLANGLRSNFTHQYSEVEIHKQLSKKIRKPTETIENYCFEMNMLGKKIQLSDRTIIQYILTGLNDSLMSSSLAAGSI